MPDLLVTSRQNERVKAAAKLRDRKGRDAQQRFLIDGRREIGRAISAGVRIVDASLRQMAGVSVVAISRERAVISNPGPEVVFVPGDRVALIGTPEQVAAAEAMF